jgi:hypothetical protein
VETEVLVFAHQYFCKIKKFLYGQNVLTLARFLRENGIDIPTKGKTVETKSTKKKK